MAKKKQDTTEQNQSAGATADDSQETKSEQTRETVNDFPWDELCHAATNVQKAVTRMFDDFASVGSPRPHRPHEKPFTAPPPAAETIEEEHHVRVILDLPGVTGDDLDVTLDGRTLNVSGTRPAPEGMTTSKAFGPFRRRVTLPCDVESDSVDATLKHGVLTVVLKRRTPKTGVKVKVKNEE